MAVSIIRFINIIIAALLAGTSFGIWVGFNPMNYSPPTYIEQQQNMVLSLNTLMVALVIIATLVTVLSAYIQRKNKIVFITLIFAALCFASCIFISRFGNLPVQQQMLNWNADLIPNNWTMLRDKWWSFHIMRTVAELVALILVTWTSVQNKTSEVK